MPNNKTFTDELAILNSQNFLGGLAEMGSAMKEGLQNKTLVQLFNEFQIEKQGLQTSGEQLSDFNKKYGANTDKEGLPTNGSTADNKLTEDAKATVNLFGYLQKQEALLGTYEPFIQAFSVLGEDGIKVAKTLTDELSRKLTLEESKGQIPFKQLEYDTLETNFNWTKEKYDIWLKDEKLRADSFKASDYIMKSNVFDLIEGGDITTWKGERLKKHNLAIKTVIDDAKKHFGTELSDSAILAGLKMAMDYTGKSFKFVEKQDFSNNNGGGLNPMIIGSMKGNLQQWTTLWNNLDPQAQKDYSLYLKNPAKFKEENTNYDPEAYKVFEDNYEIFKPGGMYASFYTTVLGSDPSWGKMDIQNVDQRPRVMTSGGKESNPTAKMNMPYKDVEIIRMKDGSSFTTGDFMWNPKWVENYANIKEDSWQSRLSGSNSFDNIYDNLNKNTISNISKRSMLGK